MNPQEQKVAQHFMLFQYVYIAMAVTYLFFGLHSNSKLLKLVLKCAPIATLLGLILYSGLKTLNALGPLSSGRLIDNLWYLLWAILFSLFGDMYLVFDGMFLLGLVSFSMTQAIYVYFFNGLELFSMLSTGLEQQQIITGLALAIITMIFYAYMYPKFSWIMAFFGFAYSLLMFFMLWAAITRAQKVPNTVNTTAALGGFLFYVSDLVLSLNAWRLKIPAGDVIVMVTYYCAQLLIARSIVVQS